MQLKQNKIGVVVINAITLEVGAGGSEVQNYLQLHKDSLDCTRQYLKRKINPSTGKKKKNVSFKDEKIPNLFFMSIPLPIS